MASARPARPAHDVLVIAADTQLDYNEAHSSHSEGGLPMSAPSEADGLLEHLVFEIAEGVSGQTGEAFFRSLVRHLAAALNADFVFVGALQPGGERIETLAAYGDGADAPAFRIRPGGHTLRERGPKAALLLPQRDSANLSPGPAAGPDGRRGLRGFSHDRFRRALPGPGLRDYAPAAAPPQAGRSTAPDISPLAPPRNWSAKITRKRSRDSEKRLRALVTHGVEAVVRIEFEQPDFPWICPKTSKSN